MCVCVLIILIYKIGLPLSFAESQEKKDVLEHLNTLDMQPLFLCTQLQKGGACDYYYFLVLVPQTNVQ